MQATSHNKRLSGTLGNENAARVAGTALGIETACTLAGVFCLAVPMYVIRPFRPQGARTLAFALAVRDSGPWVSAACIVMALCAVTWAWGRARALPSRVALVSLFVIALAAGYFTHVNIFEIMFHPYSSPAFGDAGSAQVDADDKVLAVKIGNLAHAYPIRIMGYHHIVNDALGNVPIAVTYCTLCHTGLVWNSVMDGRTLHFELAGINNGNALMRDKETRSIWQQNTGQSIFGAFKGRQLALIHSDELTFSQWRKEEPDGLVLKPDIQFAAEYEPKDWEMRVERTPTVIDTRKSGISPHELMLGVTVSRVSKAYPVKSILTAKLIQDRIVGTPVLILVGPDDASIRAFHASLAAETMTFVPVEHVGQPSEYAVMQDVETASTWNFQGCAIVGKLAGECLTPLDANKDYWFDWMNHHPQTAIFKN